MPLPATGRRILTAELLSIGIRADGRRDPRHERRRAGPEPDRRAASRSAGSRRCPTGSTTVRGAFAAGLERADLVVSTGGLGPTPDDLTREAIAAACGETPAVDPELEALAARPVAAARACRSRSCNLKQAWLMPVGGGAAQPERHGARLVRRRGRMGGSSSPCPDRPARCARCGPITSLPRLERARARVRTSRHGRYRLTGIGESQRRRPPRRALLLRATNPIVATYARVEAVDIRISRDRRTAAAAPESLVERPPRRPSSRDARRLRLGDRRDDVVGGDREPARPTLGWTLAVVEIGTAGQLAALFGDVPWLRFGEALAADAPGAHGPRHARDDEWRRPRGLALEPGTPRGRCELGGSEVGLALA